MWERGSNEKIRRFIRKGKKLEEIKKEEIKEIERGMNHYLRRLFEGKISEEIYEKLFRKVYGKKISKG